MNDYNIDVQVNIDQDECKSLLAEAGVMERLTPKEDYDSSATTFIHDDHYCLGVCQTEGEERWYCVYRIPTKSAKPSVVKAAFEAILERKHAQPGSLVIEEKSGMVPAFPEGATLLVCEDRKQIEKVMLEVGMLDSTLREGRASGNPITATAFDWQDYHVLAGLSMSEPKGKMFLFPKAEFTHKMFVKVVGGILSEMRGSGWKTDVRYIDKQQPQRN